MRDVIAVLADPPSPRWPFQFGDQAIAALPRLRDKIAVAAHAAKPRPLTSVKLLSPHDARDR